MLTNYVPMPLIRKISRNRFRAINESIRKLKIERYQELWIENFELRAIRIAGGPELIAHLPTRMERMLCGGEATAKGLDESYTKVLIDAITRYRYPHMATPFQSLPYPRNQRGFFHPQHNSLVAEDKKLSPSIKAEIKQVFMPQPNWYVLDIGAYLGHGALWLQPNIGPAGVIVCVEANFENSIVLREQIKRNNLGNVWVKNAAIWGHSGKTVSFNSSQRQANAIDAEVVPGKVVSSVKTTTLGELTTELGRAVDLASLTVNGAEVEAIDGLFRVPTDKLPKRIIAPGWYRKNGMLRSEFLTSSLEKLGYRVVKTTGNFVLAWRQNLINTRHQI